MYFVVFAVMLKLEIPSYNVVVLLTVPSTLLNRNIDTRIYITFKNVVI